MPSTTVTALSTPEPRKRQTIKELLTSLSEIHSPEEFWAALKRAERRVGCSEVLSDLITWKIDQEQIYLFENASSVYALLGKHSYANLPHEKSSIHGAIKRGAALAELTGSLYKDNMISYLEDLGPAGGRGLFDSKNQALGFTIEDFSFHRTKLLPLYNLVKSGLAPSEPDWGRFFDLGYAEYKGYCLSKMKGNPGGSFNKQSRQDDDSHRPGGSTKARRGDSPDKPIPFDLGEEALGAIEFEESQSTPLKPRAFVLPGLWLDLLPNGSLPPLAWLAPRTQELESPALDLAAALGERRSS